MGPEERFAEYARAVVRIVGVGGDLHLRPRPSGVVEGPFPFPAGTWHVLTASDPGAVRLPAAENARRGHALRHALAGHPVRHTVSSDPAGGHAEEGLLVGGLTGTAVLDLARHFGQDAVFRWTPWSWTVVPCHGGVVVEQGWAVRRPAPGLVG